MRTETVVVRIGENVGLTRRSFLWGLVAAPAVVRLPGLLMPVKAAPEIEPMFSGVRWQSWPIGATRPEYYSVGSLGSLGGTRLIPKSVITQRLAELDHLYRPVHVIEWVAPRSRGNSR